jgi:hypothetical protein
MSTTLTIESTLLDEAMQLERRATKNVVVRRALEEFIRRRRQLGIARLFGKVDYLPGSEPKAQRNRRTAKVLKN